VDDHWGVPHFEKMCYDNSELLKNYVHGHQATGSEFFAAVARDIIRWINEWLSDQGQGGFYASQDADISLDDDGDYFTWTLEEAQAVLTEEEAQVASLHYDINEAGEMHHNPEKNVLYVRASVEEIAIRTGIPRERVQALLQAAREKMYAARLQRTAPYVDKTVYVGWNSLCISAYLTAAKVFGLEAARHFALRSMDRILGEGWNPDSGLLHVIAYSDASAKHRQVDGMLDDYAFTVIACLDAYEATADLSYFNFAKNIADAMIGRFFDRTGGGFWDTATAEKPLGVLGTRRKPFQDSPTPAGNSVAAIGLMRLYGYTNDRTYRDRAEETIEVLAGVAGKYGIFAATYGIAAVHFSQAHTQVVIVGNDALADQLHAAAVKDFLLGKSVLRLQANQAVAANLPPALAATIPQVPAVSAGESVAIVCSSFSCKPPISNPEELAAALNSGESQSG